MTMHNEVILRDLENLSDDIWQAESLRETMKSRIADTASDSELDDLLEAIDLMSDRIGEMKMQLEDLNDEIRANPRYRGL